MNRRALLSAFGSALLGSGLVSADDTEVRGRVIEEIVVTAQKREQSIHDVPISISTIDGEAVRDRGLTDLIEAGDQIPNVKTVADPAVPAIYIRGFGTGTINEGFEPSVGLVVDDVALGRSIYFADAMFDVGRIEVLRGPQGTLFGQNTVAGVFNVVTAEPTDELGGVVSASIGERDLHRLEGGVGAPLADGLAFRLSFLDWAQDGSVSNSKLDRTEDAISQRAGRLKLRWNPLDTLRADFSGLLAESTTNMFGAQVTDLGDDTEAFLRQYDEEFEDDPFDQHTSLNTRGIVDRETYVFSLGLDWDVGDLGPLGTMSVKAIGATTGYSSDVNVDFDVSPADIVNLPWVQDYTQHTVELRLSTALDSLFGIGRGFEILAGVFLLESNYVLDLFLFSGEDFDEFLASPDGIRTGTGSPAVPGSPVVLPTNLPGAGVNLRDLGDGISGIVDQGTSTQAFFTHSTLDLTDRLSLVLGLRLGHEVKKGHLVGRTLGPGVVSEAVGFEDYDERRRLVGNNVAPRLSLTYAWDDEIASFVTWARGFKSGGFNGAAFTNESLQFEPESATTYEAGVKSRLFGGSLSANLGIFYTKFDNLQTSVFNGAVFVTTNAASSTSYGLELDSVWLPPWEPLSVMASMGYLDATYDSFPNAPAQAGSNETSQDIGGETLVNAPRWTATLSPEVSLPLPAMWLPLLAGSALQLGVNVDYQSDVVLDVDLDPRSRQSGYATVSARCGLARAESGWRLQLLGKNLTDVDAMMWATDSPIFVGGFVVRQIPERTLSLQLSYEF